MTDDGSLGSHPHSDRPNWQPAETIDDYARNIREGLEEYSDRRAAKMLGRSRIYVYRATLMAELPDALLERLLDADVVSSKTLANVALVLRRNGPRSADVERCPHCGEVLRVRGTSQQEGTYGDRRVARLTARRARASRAAAMMPTAPTS
jgi:hypothetical protein